MAGSVSVDFPAVMARVRRVIDDGIAFYESQIERDDGVELFREPARFSSERSLVSGGREVGFAHALIASGARPVRPAIPGLDGIPYATSDELLAATELPNHLLCLGAGAISLEFAQAYRRLGADVTIVLRGPRLLRGEDAELTELLRGYLEEEGIRVETNAAVEQIETDRGRITVVSTDGRTFAGDRLLVATGREPAVDTLGLDGIGVASGPSGVVVDSRLRTSVPHVYAIGDAIGGWMFTHVATYEAPIAVANMLDGAGLEPDYRVIPRVVFTDPELAGAGLTEEQAVASGRRVEVRRHDVGRVGKARALGDRRGRVKLVLDADSGEVLGAHILARHGADLLPGPMVAMNTAERTLAPLLSTIHPHPTLSEAVKVAARPR